MDLYLGLYFMYLILWQLDISDEIYEFHLSFV
jgi:hypothetical protein